MIEIADLNLAEEKLVGLRTVDVGGIEERNAGINGVVEKSDGVTFGLGRTVERGNPHATEALSRDLKALASQLHPPHFASFRHGFLSLSLWIVSSL